jgi:hypothetical protein
MLKTGLSVLVIGLTCFYSVHSTEFEHKKIRAEIYTGITGLQVESGKLEQSQIVMEGANTNDLVTKFAPLSLGLIINPLITPLYKVDLPFEFWLGGQINDISWAPIAKFDGESQKLGYKHMTPSLVGGFTYNIWGDFDIKALGGYGWTRHTFTHDFLQEYSERTITRDQYFGTVSLEYMISEVFHKSTQFKVGLFARQDAHNSHQVIAVPRFTGDPSAEIVPHFSGTRYAIIRETPLKIGFEFSVGFGRESRQDRTLRHALVSRDSELKRANAASDTIDAWDCMAFERDYQLFIGPDGKLSDVRHKFTKTEYTDIVETFLAHCVPEDLNTKQQLYLALDQNKEYLAKYQESQEDKRFAQVMASNDIRFLKMFLEYYPESKHRMAIESKIQVLKDYQAFKQVRDENTYASYLKYLRVFPEGKYIREAETGIFNLVQASNRIADYEIYLKKFPNGLYVNESRKAIHALQKQMEQRAIY